MDQVPLVESQFNDGQKLLDRLAEEGAATGAAWVKEYEGWQWYLYVVTPLVREDGGRRSAYRRVNEVFREMPEPLSIDRFQIKVVGPSEPVGKAILAAPRSHAGKLPSRFGGAHLGDVSIDDAYIYPPPVLTAEK